MGLFVSNQPFLASLITPAFGDPTAFVLLRLISDIQLGASPDAPHGVVTQLLLSDQPSYGCLLAQPPTHSPAHLYVA